MDQKYLQNNILSEAYNREVWQEVLKSLFGVKVLYSPPKEIPLSQNEIASKAYELGNFYTEDERLVGVYEINLSEEARTRLTHNKIGLRNLLRNVYKYDVDGALIVFIQKDKWRFSYVSEIRTEDGKKETEPKRYTYLFGKGETSRTAAERFYSLKGKKLYLQDLFDAFSVEKLNQDFFNSYYEFYRRGANLIASNKVYYSWLVNKTETDEDKKRKPIRDYVKKLLGRIVFLHFLQKKGWMGVPANLTSWENGDKQFMQSLFKNYPNKDKFNSECLHTLFFETLNTNRIDNNFLAPTKILAGWERKFRVPYLNGGLFDKSEIDNLNIDFPIEYFDSLFDFFERYNFTIDENDPYESEVGIDPEMLGHIFENLLEENREKGTFYTPKDIVYYICHEGLIEYLVTQMPEVDRSNFELLVRQNRVADNFTDHRVAHAIHDKLLNVKICDPAIGSGAFPMGMLKEIFECRRLLYPYLRTSTVFDPAKVKKEIIERNIYGVDIETGATDIARLRFWLALVVDEVEPHPLPNLDYKIMQGNSLLESFEGIDLSHVLKPDLKIFEPERDLFGNIRENQLKLTYAQSKTVDEIQKLTKQFYRLEDAQEKQKVREKIGKCVHENIQFNIDLRVQQIDRWISEIEASNAVNAKQEKKLKEYQEQRGRLRTSQKKLYELEKSNEKPFFLWHLFFDEVFLDGGFDIVIGNPPYVQLQKMGREADALQEAGYQTFVRTGDLYCMFYELGYNILKPGGNLIYITGSAWLRTNYGKALRKFFLNNTNPIQLIDLSDSEIFQSATVLTTIFQFKKESYNNSLKSIRITRKRQQNISHLANYFKKNASVLNSPGESAWSINDKEKSDIISDVVKQGEALKYWDIEINLGIRTGLNDAFIIDKTTKERLVSEDNNSEDLIAPILRGKDVYRYGFTFHNYYVLLIKYGFHTQLSQYPAILKWLLSHEHDLRLRGQCNSTRGGKKEDNIPVGEGGQHHWLELDNNPSQEHLDKFISPKILYPGIVKNIGFTYDESGYFINNKGFIISGEKLKYLTGVLNSKLFRYCYEEEFPELQGNSREIQAFVMKDLKVKRPNDKEENAIATLVEYLLFLNNKENDALFKHTPNNRIAYAIEDVLNIIVYELYFQKHMKEVGLTVLDDLSIRSLKESKDRSESIRDFYKWLQQPENKVRNKILSLDIKSPDVLSRIHSSYSNSSEVSSSYESD